MKLGNDIIETDRIRQAIEKSSSFKARVYTIHEIEYCKSRNKDATNPLPVYMLQKRLLLKL